MLRKFQRCIEDFICDNCNTSVAGDGYTDHCPECLWSRHVDVYPGDRLSSCGGMMKPAELDKKGEQFVILFVCEVCQYSHRNKAGKNDKLYDFYVKQLPQHENF